MKPGDIIEGKYRLERLLGEGAMGAVYEGRHIKIGRKVALKFLHQEQKKEPELQERFMREAQAAAAVGSEYIIDVTDVGEAEDGTPFLVMEYLEGEDLDSILERERKLAPARAANLAFQACRAVAAAHTTGIIHRDIKPANLFVTRREDGSEHVKVLDFGIAKFRDSTIKAAPNLTSTGVVLGTPYYMPPEQARGSRKADIKSDIYSMGVLLYEILTGKMPFDGETYNELIVRISMDDPTPPSVVSPELDEELERVVTTSMARDRADRYASMDELAQALLPFTDDPRLRVSFVSQPPAEPSEPRLPRLSATAATVRHPGDKRPRWVIPSATLFVLLLIVIGAYWGYRAAHSSKNAPSGPASTNDGLTAEIPREASSSKLGVGISASSSQVVEHSDGGGQSSDAAQSSLETILFEVRATPNMAQIFIDGIAVDGNPFSDHFPRDGARHRVEARAPGHRPAAQFVVFSEDRALSLRLQPSRRPPSPPTKTPEKQPEPEDSSGLERNNPYGQ